jgi:acyl-coenzyme A thioesterase PaaI-like protein
MNHFLAKVYKPKFVRFALNIWPPFWGAGIKILSISHDFREVKVRLKLRWWNKNANRTQYGGSIFSLTDPVYALMLMGILREEYYVWDKEASINFIKPGKSDLFAQFRITQPMLDEILSTTSSGDKSFPQFKTHVVDANGEIVSTIERKLYVRKKPQYRNAENMENIVDAKRAS